jgi:hypothetical protein
VPGARVSGIRRILSNYQRHLVWDIELFFKWIKQHLRIKRFYGTSENAVKTQIWIAVSMYVLIAILRRRLNLEPSLYTLQQVISVTIFEKMPLLTAFSLEADTSTDAEGKRGKTVGASTPRPSGRRSNGYPGSNILAGVGQAGRVRALT